MTKLGKYVIQPYQNGVSSGYKVWRNDTPVGTIVRYTESNGRPGWRLADDTSKRPHVYRSLEGAVKAVSHLHQMTREVERCVEHGHGLPQWLLRRMRP